MFCQHSLTLPALRGDYKIVWLSGGICHSSCSLTLNCTRDGTVYMIQSKVGAHTVSFLPVLDIFTDGDDLSGHVRAGYEILLNHGGPCHRTFE